MNNITYHPMTGAPILPPAVATEAAKRFGGYATLRLISHSPLMDDMAGRGVALLVPFSTKAADQFSARLRLFTDNLKTAEQSTLFVAFGFLIQENIYAVVLLPKRIVSLQPAGHNGHLVEGNAAAVMEALPQLIPKVESFLESSAARPFLRHDDERLVNSELESDGAGSVVLVVTMYSQAHDAEMKYRVGLQGADTITGLAEDNDNHCAKCVADYSQDFMAAWSRTENGNGR